MTAATNPRERGFTLVEMLVSLVIFALVSAAGVGILRSSVATQASLDSKLLQIGGLGRLHAVLASDLAQLVERPTRGSSGERPAFAGNENGMDFVRAGWTNLDEQARSDLQRVHWRFSGEALTRTGFAELDGEGDAAPAPFARALAGARFRYRNVDGSWSPSFASSDQAPLPAAVEVTVTPARGVAVLMVFSVSQAARPA